MQSVSSRIWTRVAVSISYDDNHYTTGTFSRERLWFVCVVIDRGLEKWLRQVEKFKY